MSNIIQDRALLHKVGTSADIVARNLAPLADEGTLAAADRDQIVWFAGEIRTADLSYADAGKRIGYDGSNIGRILSGTYGGNWSKVVEAIRAYRHLQSERAKMASADFIETSVWEAVRQTCDLALINQMPGIVIGLSQFGKTFALREYARRSQYTVRYVRIPAGGNFRATMEAIANACGVTTRSSSDTLRFRIRAALNSRTLLIIDEVHQLALATERSAKTSMEFIRELFDESGCGLVICGTKAVDNDLFNGPLKGWLEQFVERCIKTTVLPDNLPWADIEKVAEAYGLPPPEGKAAEIVKPLRMNRLVKILMLARSLAAKREETVTWEHFVGAYAAVNR